MRLSKDGVPVIILSHRRNEFLETCIESLRVNARGVSDVVVVDDSGDAEHHQWLDDHGLQFSVVHPNGNCGYLRAMQTVWTAARNLCDYTGIDHILLWEEDFVLRRRFSVADAATILRENNRIAQINLQRQAVYRIERQLGYMESHQRRGYDLIRRMSSGIPWVRRGKPFTTNPGLIRRDALDIEWPSRVEADAVQGGAEPAMSLRMEKAGYTFGWLGQWNTPYVTHVGDQMKTGHGY